MDTPTDALTTQDLLVFARRGDDQAWTEIYHRYRALLTVMVRVRIPLDMRRRFDTDDVLQNAFLSVFERIRRFEYQGEGSFRRWLTQIVVNKLRDNLRHHLRDRRSFTNEKLPAEGDSLTGQIDTSATDPSDNAERAEEHTRTLAAMSRLSEGEQEILCMRIFERLTWEEISVIWRLSDTAVRKRYEDAVVALSRIRI